MQKYDECISACKDGIDHGQKNFADYALIAKAYARIGNAYTKMSKYAEAVEAYNKSLTEHRNKEVVETLKKVEKLKEEHDKAAYLNPEKSKEAKERGNEHFKNGKYPEAVKEYTEAINRNPTDAVLYSNRAAAYTKLTAYNEGVKDCEEAIKLDPKLVKAYIRKGHLHYFKKEYSRAVDTYEAGLKLDPNNQEINENLQRTFAAMQESDSKMSNEERLQNALQDPEVKEILGDPAMRLILEQIQQDPKALMEHLRNPVVAKKMQKLMDAGILRTK